MCNVQFNVKQFIFVQFNVPVKGVESKRVNIVTKMKNPKI